MSRIPDIGDMVLYVLELVPPTAVPNLPLPDGTPNGNSVISAKVIRPAVVVARDPQQKEGAPVSLELHPFYSEFDWGVLEAPRRLELGNPGDLDPEAAAAHLATHTPSPEELREFAEKHVEPGVVHALPAEALATTITVRNTVMATYSARQEPGTWHYRS